MYRGLPPSKLNKTAANWNVNFEFHWKWSGIIQLCCFQMEAEAEKANLITGFRRDNWSHRASNLDYTRANWKYNLCKSMLLVTKIKVLTKPCTGCEDEEFSFTMSYSALGYKHALAVLDVLFLNVMLLCIPGCPGTCCLDRASLQLIKICLPWPWVLGVKASATIPSNSWHF